MKIIGCILLVILGLLVLLILFALFLPLRYIAECSCDGGLSSLDVYARLYILFHLFGADIRYKEEKLTWNFHIAWKHFSSEQSEEEGKSDTKEEKGPEEETSIKQEKNSEKETNIKQGNIPEKEIIIKQEKNPEKEMVLEQEEAKTEILSSDKKAEDRKSGNTRKSENSRSTEKQKDEDTLDDKVEAFFEKIKCTFRKTCAKIELIVNKKNKVLDFLTDEIHRTAFTKTIKELKKMMHRLKPKRLEADVCFGFEDPSVTGNILALYCMFYPSLGKCVNVTPDFQSKIFKGSLFIKGHIRAGIFAVSGLNLICNKNIRTTFHHIRNFKLDE
ncbi:MAG: DUF2953 domain-containing protein [Lachnospiraceae bacterium]|nr:DUF2953 domain-containing protein [Lachnospiraceae bacterium]